MSTYSLGLLTATIRTEPLLVGVAGMTVGIAVSVGTDDAVTVGKSCTDVGVSVPVGGGVRVGNGVEEGKVGTENGVRLAKLNKAVGVATTPTPGKTMGLGGIVEALRGRNTLTRTEQRQQNTSRTKPGNSILPICPCWL